jgi:hypothetical protein
MRIRITSVRVILAVTGLVGFGTGARAQDPDAEQTLKAAHGAYTARARQLNPVWVRYELDVVTTKAWLDATRAKVSEPGDIRHTDVVEFARKGDKYKFTITRGNPLTPPGMRNQFIVANGEATFSSANQADRILMTRKRQELSLAELPLVVVGETALAELLGEWVAGRAPLGAFKTATSTGSGGDKVVQVEFKVQTPTGYQCRCRVAPDRGYVVTRLESRNAKGGRVDVYTCDDYDTIDGIVFPRSGKHEHFTGSDELGTAVSLRLTSLETAASRIPDELFELDVPEGTSIWDQDNQVYVRYTRRVQSHLDEVITNIGPRTGLWRLWLWWGLGALLAVAAAGVIVRRLRRRAAANAST